MPQKTFDSLKIYRLDYQIVIHGMSFKEVNRRLVATRTRSIEILRLAKKELTRYFGRSPLKIALYDMKKKHGINAIKIETRTWSKYIDVKHPTQIKDWVLSLQFNPFDQLILLNFDYSTSNKKRMIQFNALSEVLGTQFARSYLNTQSNAARDFKKVLFENAPIQLSKVWEQGLRQYFNVEGGHDLKTSTNEE